MSDKLNRSYVIAALGAIMVFLACLAAASPSDERVAVTEIRLGKATDTNKRVTEDTSVFDSGDRFYVSIGTSGSNSAGVKLAAHWTFEDGQLVHDDKITIAPKGPTVTEFHLSKPSPWPAGHYYVRISLDGVDVGSRDFEVREPS